MQLFKSFSSMVLLVGGIGGSISLLVRMNGQPWLPAPSEILDAPPDEAIFGAVWLVAVTVMIWVAATAVLSIAAYLTRLPSAIRTAEWLTFPPIRWLARRSAAFILALGSLTMTTPAGAVQVPPIPIVVTDDRSPATITPGAVDPSRETMTGIVVPVPMIQGRIDRDPDAIPIPDRVADPVVDRPAADTRMPVPLRVTGDTADGWEDIIVHTVQPGESLWSISADHLTERTGRAVSAAEILPLWRTVIDLNRDRISSGDPDLILPGEEIVLPAPSADGR